MPVGSPLIQGMNLGHGECPATAGHRAKGRATSRLHHGEDPAPPWDDHDKSRGTSGEEGADLALGPSVGHTDLSKWKPPAVNTAMEAGHQLGMEQHPPPQTPLPFLYSSLGQTPLCSSSDTEPVLRNGFPPLPLFLLSHSSPPVTSPSSSHSHLKPGDPPCTNGL